MRQKILLCCILKLENQYLDEWIRYYKNLGVDKIVIYDNNDLSGKYAENIRDLDIISEGIKNGFIDVYPVPAPQPKYLQNRCYKDCYERYNKQYDWIMYNDIDEFVYIENFSDIHDFLSQDIFNDTSVIHLNWDIYDDFDIIEGDTTIAVQERFKRRLRDYRPEMNWLNNEMKSIIRGGLGDIRFKNAHTILGNYTCKTAIGNIQNVNKFVSNEPCHEGAYIKHYITKSLSEYINTKLARQKTGGGNICSTNRVNIHFYFMYNEYTAEKQQYVKERLHENVSLYEIKKRLQEHKTLIRNEQPSIIKDRIKIEENPIIHRQPRTRFCYNKLRKVKPSISF